MFGHDKSSKIAAAILRFRRARPRHLSSDIFGEAAWELLLELFIADAEGRRITGREIVSRTGTTAHVLSRWIRHLAGLSLIVHDGSGSLDDELTLSGLGMQGIESILQDARTINESTTE